MVRSTPSARSLSCYLLVVTGLGLASTARAAEALPERVEFNRDVRPILADACFACHGPDKAKRKADLRLDTEADVFADRGGSRVLVPGSPAASELVRRVRSADPKQRMPPARANRQLTPREVAVLERWIAQGAQWQKHWAFLPPRRPTVPAIPAALQKKYTGWTHNPIDAFVLERLAREALAPSPEAERTSLIRRVTLDLTGLPPTPAEVDAFLADRSPAAYEKVVERLLASPRYGERMARPWLDAARYADTNGYQSDGDRTMWRWRDWVLDALNSNMPFDQFTVEQIAGDLLPHPTLEQRIATGFNRNHRGNAEGGIIPEEYAVEYVADRVETTATVWLGLTMTCARCHDHKYDPVKQKEFYQLFAFFNNVPERGKAVKFGNSPPVLPSPTRPQQEALQALEARLADAERRLASLEPAITAAQAAWEQSLATKPPLQWSVTRQLLVHQPLDGRSLAGASFRDGTPAYQPGPLGPAAVFDGKGYVDAGDVADFGFYDKFSCAAWVYPEGDGTILSRMLDVPRGIEGYRLHLEGGRVQVHLVKRWLDDALRVETEARLRPGRWHHVLMTYDGSRVADGIKLYIDGKPQALRVHLDDLNQTFKVAEPFRVGSGGGVEGRFRGRLADARVYHDVLTPEEIAILATPESVTALAALPAEKRSAAQAAKLRACFLEAHAPEPLRQAQRQVAALREERIRLIESFPTTMVMQEMPTPRPTHVLSRGVYDRPGEPVTAGVPEWLAPFPAEAPRNRLGLARWLVDPANPLTARVAVNRYWQAYFGTGLVRTVEDFGVQGEWPSHPELLDWLATEFVRSGWDVKAMQRLIVTSATYRQSSRVTPALWQHDPDNRLLARGPRFRLAAEMVRDQALAASGLLVERLGGSSVKPYQPAGLWKELTGAEDYRQDHGPNLYRRSLYTFWKRTVAPPQMLTFDAAGRETCVVRESRTNTPLQALTLMNDVTYVEAARLLAQRALHEGGATPAERITRAFRLVLARPPRPAELQVLVRGYEDHRARYRAQPQAAVQLLSAGEREPDPRLDASELAAYTAVAGLILNLDEAVTKE